MSWVVSGYQYRARIGPVLTIDGIAEGRPCRREIAVRGMPLSLSWKSERRCIGGYDLITYASFPCPEGARLGGEATTCPKCFQRNGFNPSFYNVPRATLSPQQRTYNDRPHVVYLAAFAPHCVKVGMSTRDRVRVRWFEQGARLALIVASCPDAYEARDQEARVCREVSLPEQLRAARKRALLSEAFDTERAQQFLDRCRLDAQAALGLPPAKAEVVDLHADYLGNQRLELPLVELSAAGPAPSISGLGVGVIGDALIVRGGERQYILGLKPLLGRVVEISNVVRPNHVRPEPGQMGFGF